jgi:hypothetical protein
MKVAQGIERNEEVKLRTEKSGSGSERTARSYQIGTLEGGSAFAV